VIIIAAKRHYLLKASHAGRSRGRPALRRVVG
jgi:hypothetical protein